MKLKNFLLEAVVFWGLGLTAAASLYSLSRGTPAAFWPEHGFLVALLLLSDVRRWVFWSLAALACHFALALLVGHLSPYVATVGAAMSVIEGVAPAMLCRRLVGPDPDFTTRKALRPFIFKCVLPSALVCVALTVGLIALGGPSARSLLSFPRMVSQEFFGISFITPATAVAAGRYGGHRPQGSRVRRIALMGVLILSEAAIFALHMHAALFLVFPLVVAVSLGFGAPAAGMAALSSSLLTFVFSLSGFNHDAVASATGINDVFLLQLFELAVNSTALLATGAIAEQVRLRDAAITASEAAERATAAKSEFIALISHEIRTPLNGVLGTAQVLARQQLGEAQQKLVTTIDQSGRALLVILNDMLDISKMEAGKLALENATFDLCELIDNVTLIFETTAGAKGIELLAEVEAAAQGVWIGDATRVRQILSNLVSNALKFTEAGSVRLIAKADGDGLSVAVTDTGFGIPPDVLPRLFQDFTQADTSIARRFGGTGLGLVICRRLAVMMGGSLSVESAVGRGSTFTFAAPLRRAEATPANDPEEIETEALALDRPLRILAAEDNPVNQAVLTAILAGDAVDLSIVGDGKAALDALETHGFDLVLMDVRMPVMDGLTAVRALREREAREGLRRTPVVGLTADVMEHQVAAYRQAGMDGFVEKPIDIDKLFSTIEGALRAADVSAYGEGLRCA